MKNIKVVMTACIAAAMLCGCSAGKSGDKKIETLPLAPGETSAPEISDDPAETNAPVIGEIVITRPEEYLDYTQFSFDPLWAGQSLLDNLTFGNYEEVYAQFSNELMQEITEEELAEMWEKMVLPLGERGGSNGFGVWVQEGYVIVGLDDIEFEYGSLTVEIAYSQQGSVEGINFYYV